MAVPPPPVRVSSQRSLVSSVASVTSNDKGDNEMIPGAVHRSPGLCLTTEENPGKPQLGDRLSEGTPVCLVIFAMVSFFVFSVDPK